MDGRDRPTIPITISNCGELQLRSKRPSEAPESKFAFLYLSLIFAILTAEVTATLEKHSKSTLSSEGQPKQGKRRSKRSSTPESDQPRRNKKKSKHRRQHSSSLEDGVEAIEQKLSQHPVETEEEYDARLEREEKERLEIERKQELERVRQKYEDAAMSTDGVRFKGRGYVLTRLPYIILSNISFTRRMKFVDPELNQRR